MRQARSRLIAERARELAIPIACELGLDLLDVEWKTEAGRKVLRVYLDRSGGIGHEHCEAFSRRLDAALEAADFILGRYLIEVSSPGAERQLKSEADLVRFSGRRVLVKSKVSVGGKTQWKGQLLGPDQGNVVLQTDAGKLILPSEEIALIRLSLD